MIMDDHTNLNNLNSDNFDEILKRTSEVVKEVKIN